MMQTQRRLQQARVDLIRTNEHERVDDVDAETAAETEMAADVLAFGRFRAESEGGLAAGFLLHATAAESAPLKCVLMSLGAMLDFALSDYLLDVVGFVGCRICSLN